MAVNWGTQNFGLGKPTTALNIQPGIQNFYTGRADRREESLANLTLDKEERALKKQGEIDLIRQSSINQQTGQINTKRYMGLLDQSGHYEELSKMTKRMNDAQDRQIKQRKAQEESFTKLSKIYANLETPEQKQRFYSEKMGGVGPDGQPIPITPQANAEIMGRTVEPSTRKEQLEAKQKQEMNALNEEFRTQYLPNLDISTLQTDKNARNEIVKEILSSKHWKSDLAKETIKALKGKTTNLGEQIANAINKVNVSELKLTGEEQKGLGAIEPAVKDLNKLITMYREGDTGTLLSAVKAVGSKIPWFGQRMFPNEAAYEQHQKVMSERFLRIATGAAAPDNEVKTYMSFLPAWGSTPAQAKAAVESFMDNVRAKANQSVSRLRALGTPESIRKANLIDSNIKLAFSKLKDITGSAQNVKNESDIMNMNAEQLKKYLEDN